MLSNKNMFKLSMVSLALAALLSGCQADTAAQATPAVQALDINASHYYSVQLAGVDYQLFTTATDLQVRNAERELARQSGKFSRLTLQPLNSEAVLLAAMDTNSNSLYLWRFAPKEAPGLQLLQRQLISRRVVDDLCFYHSSENQQLSLFLLGG